MIEANLKTSVSEMCDFYWGCILSLWLFIPGELNADINRNTDWEKTTELKQQMVIQKFLMFD